MARILVTGAAGFIGRALCRTLNERGHAVVAATRLPGPAIEAAEVRALGKMGPETDWSGWSDALRRTDIVIHLANHAHSRGASARRAFSAEPAAAAALAGAAARAGVRRLVYLSSVKAMGEFTRPGAPFRPTDPPQPQDGYGRNKLACERALAAAARQSGIELVVLRPPLVYGPGVRANFRALIKLAASGAPLPFAAVRNRRSLIFRDNLADLIAVASTHPAAPGRVWLARDAVDWSTPALLRALAQALGRRARLVAAPPAALALARTLPLVGAPLARLTLSLQVDDAATRAELGWAPPVSAEAGLAATARAYARAC